MAACVHDEMSRETDALHFDSRTSSYFHPENRQEDRVAPTSLENSIQVGVVRIAVFVDVAADAVPDCDDAPEREVRGAFDLSGESIEVVEDRSWLDVWMSETGDLDCSEIESL